MKTLDLVSTKTTIEKLLKMARNENLIIKTSNGEEFILAPVAFEVEVESLRYNEEFLSFLDMRAKEPKIPLEGAKIKLLEQG